MSETTTKSAKVTIDLDDVRTHGTIEAAVVAACERSEILLADASAMGGQTFQTSGPGSGWSRNLTAGDYASAAISEDVAMSGCDPSDSSAIDPTDGRLAHGVDPDDGDEYAGEVTWEQESSVALACPDMDDAMQHPETTATMAQAVIDYHGPRSDRAAWAKLVRTIRDAAEQFEDIDLSKLDD